MTITRLRVTEAEADDYGDAQTVTESRLELDDAFVAPRMSEGLDAASRSGVVIGLDLYLPFGSDVVYSDRVEVDGVVYEVEGEPGSWRQPWTRWEAGMVVALKRGEG